MKETPRIPTPTSPSGVVCKICKVPVKSLQDPTPLTGNHKNGCLRRM